MTIVAHKGRGKHPWRWQLVAANGRIMADGSEGYTRKQNLRRALHSLGRVWMQGHELRVIWR